MSATIGDLKNCAVADVSWLRTYALPNSRSLLGRVWAGFLQFVNVFATVALAFLTYSVVQVTKEQSQTAKTDQRPWIGAPKIMPNCLDGCSKYKINFTFTNSGKTPTNGLDLSADVVFDSNLQPWFESAVLECNRRSDALGAGFYNFNLFPKDDFEQSAMPGFNFDEVPISSFAGHGKAYIIGCVLYGSRFDNEVHRTLFSSSVEVVNGKLSIGSVKTLVGN